MSRLGATGGFNKVTADALRIQKLPGYNHILLRASGQYSRLGKYVGLVDNAKLDASGDAGGGTILIGGNFQGKGPEPNACRTYVGKDVEIKADALSSGDGGRVIVWSDDATRFYGNISAKGGLLAGDGGFAEVSGKKALAFNGKADLSAVNGRFGTLLLDPDNIYINGSGHGAGEDISDTTIATILQTADLKLSANSKLFTSDKVTSVHPESPDLNVSAPDFSKQDGSQGRMSGD